VNRSPDLWLQTAPDLEPRPVPEDDERGVSYAHGRYWRDERSISVPNRSPKPADVAMVKQRTRKAAESRLAEGDRALTTLVQLGEAFRLLREG